MAGERLLVPMEEAYAMAVGRATFIFARLEWNVVWCCERMNPGYIRNLEKKTAGTIACGFLSFAGQYPSYGAREEFLKAGDKFAGLVLRRNKLVHAKPGTAKDGAQRLFVGLKPWTVETIDALADDFAACSTIFNAFLYGELKANEKPNPKTADA